MRSVLVFFLFLCFLLLKGYDCVYVYAGENTSLIHNSSTQNIQKNQFNSFGTSKDFSIIKNYGLSEEKEDFNIENEEEDFVFSRRYLSLTKFFIALTYSSILIAF